MKVTTELKNLIKRSFDEKRAVLQREAKEKVQKQYNDLISDISSSDEFKAVTKTMQAFYNKYKNLICGCYCDNIQPWYTNSRFTDIGNIENKTADFFFSSNVGTYSKSKVDIADKIKELDLQQESLMIKLTYEKDIDSIRTMLAEYDITI